MIYGILIAASFAAAFVSGAAGFGGALLLLPVVTACVGAELAVPVLTIAQLIGNLSRMAFGFREIDWRSVGLFSITALPLAALGAFGFAVLPKDIVTRCIGAALILLVLAKTLKKMGTEKQQAHHADRRRDHRTRVGACWQWWGPIGAAAFLTLGAASRGVYRKRSCDRYRHASAENGNLQQICRYRYRSASDWLSHGRGHAGRYIRGHSHHTRHGKGQIPEICSTAVMRRRRVHAPVRRIAPVRHFSTAVHRKIVMHP